MTDGLTVEMKKKTEWFWTKTKFDARLLHVRRFVSISSLKINWRNINNENRTVTILIKHFGESFEKSTQTVLHCVELILVRLLCDRITCTEITIELEFNWFARWHMHISITLSKTCKLMIGNKHSYKNTVKNKTERNR